MKDEHRNDRLIQGITIQLPTVEAQEKPTIERIREYDDSADISVEQSKYGYPYANLRIVPGGPVDFCLLGFTTKELRQLGKFLMESAETLDKEVSEQRGKLCLKQR